MCSYFPQPEAAIQLYYKYFLNRDDLYPVYICYRISIAKAKKEILLAHTTGNKISVLERTSTVFLNTRSTVKCGTYTPGKDNKTKYACIDFDGKGHSSPLKNPEEAIIKTHLEASAQGIPSHIEKSSGGSGFHLWIFFEQPVDASYARALCHCILPKDLEYADGTKVEIGSNKGIEIFPKTDQLKKGGVGNQVWLPWYHAAKDTGGIFYKYKDSLSPYVPEKFETLTLKDLNAKLTNYGGVEEILTSNRLTYSNNLDKTNDVWKIWRKAVLDNLDLDIIYGKYVTGSKRGEWLECRDPWSDSGDRDPSSGVATGSGDTEKGTWHSFRTAETLSVFDFIRKIGITEDNHFAACRYMADVTGVDLPKTSNSVINDFQIITSTPISSDLPQVIINNRQLLDIVEDTWRAMQRYNNISPRLFIKSGKLAKINFLEEPPSLKLLEEKELYGILSRAATWAKLTNSGMMNAFPPDKVAEDMLYCDHPIKSDIPKLEAIVTTPIFSRTKELVIKEGYNEGAQVWYKPSVNLSDIPVSPTEEDVKISKGIIEDELLCNFPFCNKSDLAHTYSTMLLPFVRQLIDGPTPLHVIEAPGPGTGKSKLCNIISILTVGTSCEARSIPNGDEEIRKMITAELIKSRPIILLDNASEKKKLDSAALAAVITTTSWTDRYLGESSMITLSNQALWLLTANNPQMSVELARRCVRVRLDAKTDQPWKRKEFKHPYIEEWSKDNRGLLVRSIIILIKNWINKGCPAGKERLGSFERWSCVIGGILEVNGIQGFLGNLDEMYESSDKEGNAWRAFVTKWFNTYGGDKKTAHELLEMCDKNTLMYDIIGDGPIRTKLSKLLNALNSAKDRVIGEHKIHLALDGSYKLVDLQGKTASTQPNQHIEYSETTCDDGSNLEDIKPEETFNLW